MQIKFFLVKYLCKLKGKFILSTHTEENWYRKAINTQKENNHSTWKSVLKMSLTKGSFVVDVFDAEP